MLHWASFVCWARMLPHQRSGAAADGAAVAAGAPPERSCSRVVPGCYGQRSKAAAGGGMPPSLPPAGASGAALQPAVPAAAIVQLCLGLGHHRGGARATAVRRLGKRQLADELLPPRLAQRLHMVGWGGGR